MHPTYWPEVRRGAERLTHDTAEALARAGHEVTVLTSHPGRTAIAHEDGFRVVRSRRAPQGLLVARGFEHHLPTLPDALARAARGRYDLVHAFSPVPAMAAALARRLGGPPVVLSLMGVPSRRSLDSRRLRRRVLRSAIEGAHATTVLSSAAADAFRREIGGEARVLPAGIWCERFEPRAARAPSPTVVCAASLDDRRKRGPLLLRAFARVRRRRPDARLLLAGARSGARTRPDPPLPPGVEAVDAGRTEDLARAYAGAWTSVLPSVEEAFGLVLVESLAAGTPVVAARSGASPEIVDDDRIGRLFAPDDEDDLVRALEEGLGLGRDPEAEGACRRRARDYDWNAVLPDYERLYWEAIAAGARRARGGHAR